MSKKILLGFLALLTTFSGHRQPLVPNEIELTVRVEFMVFSEEVMNYPEVAMKFADALDVWSKVLPIEPYLIMDHSYHFPGMMLKDPIDRPGIIQVHFVDMSEIEFRFDPENLLGVWLQSKRLLYLDADSLSDPKIAFHVSLHELGHAFGLGHIAFQENLKSTTGDITMPKNEHPEEYVMFPVMNHKCVEALPSRLEIRLATNYVIYHMTVPGNLNSKAYLCK